MTSLCGARATGINNGLTCGKAPHDVRVDPVHRFVAGDPATVEWTDDQTTTRTAEDVAADPRPLGWLFDQNGSRWSRG